jgi:hypothetical protein
MRAWLAWCVLGVAFAQVGCNQILGNDHHRLGDPDGGRKPDADAAAAFDADAAVDMGAADDGPAVDGVAPVDAGGGDVAAGEGGAATCAGVVCTALDSCHDVGTCDPVTGACSNPVKGDDSACDDGNKCTQNDTCQTGKCVGGPAVVCTAKDDCHTAGTCDPATGICSMPAKTDGSPCDDGLVCTSSDSCKAGVCHGTTMACDDGVACSVDSCSEQAGGCVHDTSACSCTAVNDPKCDDHNPCNGIETCDVASSKCKPGTPVDCSGMNDACNSGTCSQANGQCVKTPKANGTTCSDGSACTQTDSCQAGQCVGANPVLCTAQDQCHSAGTCDPTTGICSNLKKPDGAGCSDGDLCTQTDSCQSGVCVGANPVVCAAPDQCHTVGACNKSTGACPISQKADGASCDDGNKCTQTDSCLSGVCTGASPVTCAAPDQCHMAGVCNTSTGVCAFQNKGDGTTCSDSNACTQNDTCQAGVCVSGVAVTCTALDQCHTAGTCNTSTGVCSNPTKADTTPCSDGLACTSGDACTGGVCKGTAVNCDDGLSCSVDSCSEQAGGCVHDKSACPCTTLNDPKCDDHNACNGVETCDVATATCQPGTPVDCSAMNDACNTGTCVAATGACTKAPKTNGTSCDDGNKCTQSDSCQAGTCTGTNPVVCAGADQCHMAGVCQPSSGTCTFQNQADGTGCNDGNACTQTDTCQAGVCTGANPKTCAAQDSCHTAGACNTSTGACTNPVKADGATCSDGNACTTGDTCLSGSCMAGTSITCSASDECHLAGTCDTSTGVCSNPIKSNGSACGTVAGYSCQNGTCSPPVCFVAGTPITMADMSTRSIERIKEGDLVLSYDPSTGGMLPGRVLKTFRHPYAKGADLVQIDGTIVATPEHPFFVNGEWVSARKLRVGDEALRVGIGGTSWVASSGVAESVTSVDIKPSPSEISVYNLEVDRQHDYFAGGLLVHNGCGGQGLPAASRLASSSALRESGIDPGAPLECAAARIKATLAKRRGITERHRHRR